MFLSAPAAEAQPGPVLTSRCYHPLLESTWHCWEPAQRHHPSTRFCPGWEKWQYLTCAFSDFYLSAPVNWSKINFLWIRGSCECRILWKCSPSLEVHLKCPDLNTAIPRVVFVSVKVFFIDKQPLLFSSSCLEKYPTALKLYVHIECIKSEY